MDPFEVFTVLYLIKFQIFFIRTIFSVLAGTGGV